MIVTIDGVEYVPAYRPKPGDQFESLGHALQTIRKSRQLSLDAAAKLVGCTKSHLWALEKGASEPGIRLAQRLAEAYGVPLSVLALCAMQAPESWEHLKQYGYAPGDYLTRCGSCGGTFVMDKRATSCKRCAEIQHASSARFTATKEQSNG